MPSAVQNPRMSNGRNWGRDPAIWALILGVIGFVVVLLLANDDKYLYAGVVAVIAAGVGYFGARVLLGGGYISEEKKGQEPPAPPGV